MNGVQSMQIWRILSDKAISPRAPEGNGPEEGGPESILDTLLLQEYANLDMYAAGGFATLQQVGVLPDTCMQQVGVLPVTCM